MRKILFICQGNICRSPAAMFYLRHRLDELSLLDQYLVTSAALEMSTDGMDMEQNMKDELDKYNIPYHLHGAHKLNPREFLEQDYVLYMEKYQKILIGRIMSNNHMEKAHRLYDYTGVGKDILDPYVNGDYETAFKDIMTAVDAFIDLEILNKK